MGQESIDFETTFFRGSVRFRGGDADVSHFELADGSARISVPNNIHVRLIEQITMPPTFEIVVPMTHVTIEGGQIPEHYQVRQRHSYYRELEERYVPLQLDDAQRRMATPSIQGKKAGCLSMVALFVLILIAVWVLTWGGAEGGLGHP